MRKFDLLERASSDIGMAEKALSDFDEEIYLDQASYHVQQAIEKIFKYHMSVGTKVPFPKVHDFDKLCDFADTHQIPCPKWISDNSARLSDFESETRYGTDLVASRRTIIKFLELAKSYLRDSQQNRQIDKMDLF